MRTQCGALLLILFALPFQISALSKYLRDPEICGNPKCPDPQKFGYVPKVKYKYKYNVDVNTIFDGSGNKTSNMTISSHFFIYFRTHCEGILQILDADLIGDENDELAKTYRQLFNTEMTKNYLRFAFEDGRISQICPMDNEHVWVFNFKKGILSSLQNNMKRFDVDYRVYERDVNGDCSTVYTFRQQNGTTLVISKKKLIPTCANRHTFYSIIPLSNYVFQHRYHKWTPMNSSVSCHQDIDHRILTRVACYEEHIYQPFHSQPDGVKSTARNELVLISEDKSLMNDLSSYNKLGVVKHRDDLLFNHRRPKRATHDDIYDCKVLLKRLCVLSTKEFQAEFPDIFNQFIHIARDLSTPALSQLFKDSNSTCETGRKHMKDALPFIRTRASTYLMTEELLSREISEGKILEWLTVMAFFPRPDKETIDSVSNLLKQKRIDDQALLSVSSMVHSFCENQRNCESHPSVQDIVSVLEGHFNNTMLKINETQRVLGLKAVQNAGVMTPTMARSLMNCINDVHESIELRIHCINAHRRMDCDINRNELIQVYRNQSNDQELRIASYLQLMRCPSYYTLKIVKSQLEVEEFNQVGSFVWSHLKNIMRSSMPYRMEFQAMLQDEELNDKFRKDFRKYSRHYETSFFLNSVGIGGIIENLVIFSEHSFIPRTLTTNLTIHLFGEAVNVCELTLRFEGLDDYLEKWFKKMKMDDVFEHWFKKVNPFKNENAYKGLNMMRYIRQVTSSINEKIDSVNYKHYRLKQLKISLSMKTFGNDLKYYVINGDKEFNKILENINPIKIVNDFLKGQTVSYERSIMLMDTSYVTPMCSGLPLKFNLVGTTAIILNAMGHVRWDRASDTNPDTQLDIEGQLSPSIGLNFEAYMYVDAFVEQTGVKFKGNVYTSTAFEGNLKATGFKHITVSFNLPMKKSQIFNAESELMIIKGEKTILLEGVTGGKTENRLCSWSILDETIGLKMCLNYLLPDASLILQSPSFLFSGPLKLGLTLEKSDPTANKFLFEYKMENLNNKTLVRFSFETPGSQTKRGMKAVIDLDTQSQNLTLSYQSNLTTLEAQGFYRNTPNEKLINFGLDINGQKHIDIHLGLEIEENKHRSIYRPKLLFAINNKRIASLSGSYKWVDKKGVSQCDIDLDFQTNKFSINIGGYVRKNSASISTRMKIGYVFMTGRPETVVILIKLADKSSRMLIGYLGVLQLESSAYPQINMSATARYNSAQDHRECLINLYTDPLAMDEKKRLHIQWSFQQIGQFLGMESKFNTSLVIAKPISDIDVAMGFVVQVTPESTTSDILVQYATGKKIQAVLDLVLPHGSNFNFEMKLMVLVIPQAVEPFNILFKINEKFHRGEYDIEFVGTWFSGDQITVKGVYLDRSTLSLTSHSVKLLARSQLFSDLHLSSRFIMSMDDCRADFTAEYLEVIYGVTIRHSTQGIGMYETFGEVKYNNSVYTVSNFIDLIRRQTILEFHLDRYRDIRIQLKGFTNKTRLDAGIDVRWDANRDPTRKFIFLAITNAHGKFNYDGKLLMEYPDTVVTAVGFTKHQDKTYKGDLKVEWSPKDQIRLTVRAMHDFRRKGTAELDAKVTTPFKNWENTELGYSLKMQSNALVSYGSISWLPNQNIKVEISYDYLFGENTTDLNFRSVMNSTVEEVNSMHAIFKYNQAELYYKTDFSLQTTPEHVIAVGSSGEIEHRDDDSSKYRLSVDIATPFSLMRETSMSSELNLYPENKLKGSIHFAGNDKRYGAFIEGDLKLLNESKINVHLSTPFEKYKQVGARYSFSSSRKHFIIEIKSSSSSLGTELLYIYNNMSDFNVKLHFHTSLIMPTNILLVGKLSSDMVDMRIGWSKLVVGLIGSSHYSSWYDVDYSLQLFTPFEQYHSCSAIAKFIFTGNNKIDFEGSVNFADKKIGLRIQGMENPEDDFAIPPTTEAEDIQPSNDTEETNKSNVTRLEFSYPPLGSVYWRGIMQLDSLLYPTVYAYTQINQDDSEYFLATFFNFPFGQLKINDEFRFDNILNIKNLLSIESTSNFLQDVRAYVQLEGDMTEATSILSKMELSKKSHDNVVEGKMDLKYIFEPEHENAPLEGKYDVVANIRTSFEMLRYCHVDVKLKAEKHLYGWNVSVDLTNSSVKVDGVLEFDDAYFESDIGIALDSPYLKLPESRIIINKDFADLEKKLDLELKVPNSKGDGFVKYGVSAVWNNVGSNFKKYYGHIITPNPKIGTIKGGININSNLGDDQFFMEMFLKYSESNEIKIMSSLKGNKLSLMAESSFQGFREMNATTTINRKGNLSTIKATLKGSKDYHIHCWATFTNNESTTVEIKMTKVPSGEEVLEIVVNVYNLKNGYDFNGLLTLYNNQVTLRGNYIIWDKFGKHVNALITSTFPGYESLKMDGVMLSRNNDTFVSRMIANVDSSKLGLHDLQVEIDFNLAMIDPVGVMEWNVNCPYFKGRSLVKWMNQFLEQMSLTVDADCSFGNETKDIYLDAYSWNIDKEFQEISLGSEIRYNKNDWRFNANGTLIVLSLKDMKFLSHVLLPNKKEGMHTISAKLNYLEDFSHFSHLIKYNRENKQFSFQSMSQIEVAEEAAKGALLVQTGTYRFFDKFNGHIISNGYKVNNLLQSTNMDHDLIMNLLYRKPRESHQISVDVFYPPDKNIVRSNVDFIAINNVEGKINFTTPFEAFPNVEIYVVVVTSPELYKRFGRVQWKNQSAVFNYTHASVLGDILQLTEGSVLADFPLHSRHKALLVYSYESTKEKALGKSRLHYNDEFMMSGNYSRKTVETPTSIDEVIKINVNNSLMPAGISYGRMVNNHTDRCCNSGSDIRRVEVFKLNNKTDFNLTGEYEVESSDHDKLRIIRAFVGQRNVKLESYHRGENLFISRTNFTFKRGFWIGYDFSKVFRENKYGHEIELNVTYPRRHFTMQSDYFWEEDEFYGEVLVHPNVLKKAKYVGAEISWKDEPFKADQKSVLFKLSHPSFNKNVTLLAEYHKNDSAIFDVDVAFEYSTEEKKRLTMTATLLKDKKYLRRWYQLVSMGNHYATRFHYAGNAVGKFYNSLLQLNSSLDYKRSYSPVQQWNSSFKFDLRNKLVQMKRKSLWEDVCLFGRYYRLDNEYLASVIYRNNQSAINGQHSRISGNFSFDIEKCKTYLSVNFTPDSSEQLHMEGMLVDSGHAMLNVWRLYDDIPVQDISSHIRLNTSRILSSQLTWRPQIPQDVMDMMHDLSNKAWAFMIDSAHFWTTYIKTEAGEAMADIWLDAKPIIQDYLEDIRDVKDLLDDIKYFKKHFNESYKANEFYMQDIYNMYLLMAEEMSFKDKMHNLPKIFSELSDIMGETSETIRQSIIWAVELVQKIYNKVVVFAKELMSGETLNKISLYIQEIALKYDKLIKDVHISFLQYMEKLWEETSDFISEHWIKLLNAVEPTFITFAHHIESAFWEGRNKAIAFLFQGPAEIMKNSIFNNSSSLKEIDKIYKDITSNDFLTNVKKYSQLFFKIVKEKYFSIVPFGYELNEIGIEVVGVAKELYKLPVVNFTIEASFEVYNQVIWMYNYFKISEKFQKAVPVMYKLIRDTSHTALDNEMTNHKSKTLFIFDVEQGIIKLEQKLPMPWHAFNETPNFEEIPEYRAINQVQKFFAPSNKTFWSYYSHIAPIFDTASWLPPFQGRAVISGMQHFITFDKSHLDLRFPCSFLLSKDYVNDTFALVLNYDKGKHTLILISDNNIVTYDPHDKAVSVNRGGNLVLPLEMKGLDILEDEGLMKVISEHGFTLECNFDFDVCVFTLSGWYFGKVAGLLGTMDNEAKNDYLSSSGKVESNFKRFAMSWALGVCNTGRLPSHKKPLNNNESCNSIYLSKGSPFTACYPLIDPSSYNMMCRKSVPGILNEVCTSAYSYVKACEEQYIPVTMPNFCVRCPALNGTSVEEGHIYDISEGQAPNSTDVVFIIEAKECNQYMRERRLVQIFISTLTKELSNVGLNDTRFAVVSFGGSGIFDEPRKVFFNNKFFTNERSIPNYFESIPSGNGNSDIFGALKFASKLQFRPGVSKTFILLPCNDCDPRNMSLDYQTLQTILIEKDIKLHILMNADFDLEKLKVSKVFYGLDSERAYTKSDFKNLKGDFELRRQIRTNSPNMYGQCCSLAMTTNGTLFTAKKLGSENTSLVKKFCTVFSKRIAHTAQPSPCQTCECTTFGEGIYVTECFPCFIPSPIYSDFDFRDNSTLTLFDRFDPIRESDFLLI